VAQAAARFPAMDETMELPIFREVESAWFKASTPAPRPASDSESVGFPDSGDTIGGGMPGSYEAGVPAQDDFRSTADSQTASRSASSWKPAPDPASGLPKRQIGTPPAMPDVPEFDPVANRPEPAYDENRWRTAADQGWRIAQEMTAMAPEESTGAGLPKRRPMERLVPGSVDSGVEEPIARPTRRDPEGVRGLLSAYHRGVQRGRGNDTSMTSNLRNRSDKERN
jgi:hypothetical protein